MSPNQQLPNLMQVRAWVRVAELGSVSKASEALFRAQSVVTRAILDIEAYLGVSLFERHPNGMRLTEEGAKVLPRAQRVLDELNVVSTMLGGVNQSAVEPLYLFQTRRLQLFVKLCETHHMRTVANLFALTQPAVSAALKVLESGAGVRLFERTPQGLLPTSASCEIVFPIRRALNELRHIPADLAAAKGSLEGVVYVGALPLGRTSILPEAVASLVACHPDVQVVTNESPFDLLATDLRAGDIDFIFGALRNEHYASDLCGEPLMYEQMVILVRQGHPLLTTPLTSKHLEQACWILPRAGSPAREMLTACFEDQGMLSPRPTVESGDLAIIRGLLERSDMLAVVSAHQLECEISSQTLCVLPWTLYKTDRAIGLTLRRTGLPSPASQALMTLIRQVTTKQQTVLASIVEANGKG